MNILSLFCETPVRTIPEHVASAPYHRRHLVVWLASAAEPEEWPKEEERDRVVATLRRKWTRIPVLKSTLVTFSDVPVVDEECGEDVCGAEDDGEARYSGFLYPDFLPVPSFTLSDTSALDTFFRRLSSTPDPPSPPFRRSHVKN
ncbi:ferredoxin [Pseudohyphozyma bogoriensis]|nr:ferredoxin [Pseudohyphozyma bogoriensis]